MIQNSSPSFFPSIGNRLGSSPYSQAENKLPSEQRRKETDLKKGSIIGGIFIALVSIVAFIELHSGISIFAAFALAGTAMTGWFYAREDESDKKKNSSYRESSSRSFFGAVPIEVNDPGTGKHNSPTAPRMKIP